MTIDGVTFDIPDTPANAAAFGRPVTRRNGEAVDGGYPQIHAIVLSETGTHLIVEAFVKRAKKSEFPLAGSLLRKVPPSSLVLWDRGFYGYCSLVPAQRRGVHVVGRVADHVDFEVVRPFDDGSFLPPSIRPGAIDAAAATASAFESSNTPSTIPTGPVMANATGW